MSDISKYHPPMPPVSAQDRERGAHIRRTRMEKGMTLGEASRALGVSVVQFSSWEHGRECPNRHQYIALLRLFGVM